MVDLCLSVFEIKMIEVPSNWEAHPGIPGFLSQVFRGFFRVLVSSDTSQLVVLFVRFLVHD